jgi:AraC-like DNA-binding protein
MDSALALQGFHQGNQAESGSARNAPPAEQGECNIERVAGIFSIHRVTLHRYLREEGTSFEVLLDESRRDMAEHMLTSSDQPIADIATALGYRAAGSFVRAFARWHGTTPGAWRTRRPAARRVAASARRLK